MMRKRWMALAAVVAGIGVAAATAATDREACLETCSQAEKDCIAACAGSDDACFDRCFEAADACRDSCPDE